jgi:hypothetical protein
VSEDSQSPTKELVRILLNQGRTVARTDDRFSRCYDWAEIRVYYDEGHSMRECQAKYGFSGGAWTDATTASRT